ncbi:MAG: 5'-methylthioadenosine/adenosylhomocysteine nucleosidase [bacterium]
MKIGILGAMQEEVGCLEGYLQNIIPTETGQRTYLTGSFHHAQVTVVFSRWGKVAAASTVTTLIERFGVELVLFIGVAGAADASLNVGDIVVATDLMQYDMDASALRIFQKHEIPLLNRKVFPILPQYVSLASECAHAFLQKDFTHLVSAEIRNEFSMSHPKVAQGLIASGDQFIADKEIIRALRKELPGLLCIEMEGGAVAQVCYEHNVPLMVIRVISDKANHEAAMDFPKFVAKASSFMSGGVAHNVLTRLTSSK